MACCQHEWKLLGPSVNMLSTWCQHSRNPEDWAGGRRGTRRHPPQHSAGFLGLRIFPRKALTGCAETHPRMRARDGPSSGGTKPADLRIESPGGPNRVTCQTPRAALPVHAWSSAGRCVPMPAAVPRSRRTRCGLRRRRRSPRWPAPWCRRRAVPVPA